MKIITWIFLLLIFIFKIIINHLNVEFSDILSIISILVDIAIPVYIAYILQNKFLKNRDYKGYYLKKTEALLDDYDFFLYELKRGKLNRSEITNSFKNFTIRINFIEDKLENEFKINDKLQPINRKLQILITVSTDFNTTVTSSKVKLSKSNISKIDMEHRNIMNFGGNVIKKLQK